LLGDIILESENFSLVNYCILDKAHVIIISSHVSIIIVVVHEVVLEEVVVIGVLDIRIISNSEITSRCVIVCLISLLIQFFYHILLVDTIV